MPYENFTVKILGVLFPKQIGLSVFKDLGARRKLGYEVLSLWLSIIISLTFCCNLLDDLHFTFHEDLIYLSEGEKDPLLIGLFKFG